MPAVTISAAPRLTTYTPSNSVGPFAVGFPVFDEEGAGLVVTLNGVEQVGNWTFDGDLESGFYGAPNTWVNGTITFSSPITGALDIRGQMEPSRTSNFAEGRGIPARDINTEFNRAWAAIRENYDRIQTEEQESDTVHALLTEALADEAEAREAGDASTLAAAKDYVDDNALRLEGAYYDADGRYIRNVPTPENSSDAVSKGYLDARLAALGGTGGATVSGSVSHTQGSGGPVISVQSYLDESAIYLTAAHLTIGSGANRGQAVANVNEINEATQIAANRGNGCPVVLPAGVIVGGVGGNPGESPWLYWRSRVPLIGRGIDITTLLFHGSHGVAGQPGLGNFFIFTGNTTRDNPARNLLAKGFTIDMNRAGQVGPGNKALLSCYAIDREDRDILIKNIDGPGVYGLVPLASVDWGTIDNPYPPFDFAGAPNRPALAGSFLSERVRVNNVVVDGTGATTTADLSGFGGVDGLWVENSQFIGGGNATFAAHGCKNVFLSHSKIKSGKFGGYFESCFGLHLVENVIEGLTQEGAALTETLPFCGFWLCTLDLTFGGTGYDATTDFEVLGNVFRNLTRIQPGVGNTTAGGAVAIYLTGLNATHPVRNGVVAHNVIDRVRALAQIQSPVQGSSTAKGYGIRAAGSVANVDIGPNRIFDVDVGVDLGGTIEAFGGTADLNSISLTHNRVRGYKQGVRWHDATVTGCTSLHNELQGMEGGGTQYAETGLTGALTIGGSGNQIVHAG